MGMPYQGLVRSSGKEEATCIPVLKSLLGISAHCNRQSFSISDSGGGFMASLLTPPFFLPAFSLAFPAYLISALL